MNVDPNRQISITLPFEMVERLKNLKPVLAMFSDQSDVRKAMDIIDAIYNGAIEFLSAEEDQIRKALQKEIESDLEGDFEDFDEDEEELDNEDDDDEGLLN